MNRPVPFSGARVENLRAIAHTVPCERMNASGEAIFARNETTPYGIQCRRISIANFIHPSRGKWRGVAYSLEGVKGGTTNGG